MKIADVVKEDITRRGFLQGAGAAAVAGAAGKAGAGQYKSMDELNKDPGAIEKIWKPRMAELQARCTNILKSFASVAPAGMKPPAIETIQNTTLKISIGDDKFKVGNYQTSWRTDATGKIVGTPTGTIIIDVTVFWDAPDSILAFVLGHELGHIIFQHGVPTGTVPVDNSPERSRRNELEADRMGAYLSRQIGYDKAAFFEFLKGQKAQLLKSTDPNYPDPSERAKFLQSGLGYELSHNAVKYIDSMAQQFQSGLAEGMAQDEAEETNGWRAELVNQINYNTFEVKMTNTRSKESANFVVRPVDMISIGPTLQIETMDVHDLQTGQTESWTSDDPQPDGGIVYAIAMMFWDNKELQKKLWTIVDTHNTKGQDTMPGLDQRRSIGQEVDADAYIDSQEKTQDVMAKMKKGMAEDDVGEGIRVPAQQILGTKNRAKSAYYPTNVKPKVPKLDKPLTDQELARLAQLAGIKSK